MVLSQFSKTPGAPAAYAWKDYVYREGQLLGSRASDGTLKHFDVDHLGTVRLETNASGMKLAYRELWPYGEDATPATNDERLRFTGHERDLGVLGSTADDMDYMHARYYRPVLGRFLSMDPSGRGARSSWPQSWNRYTYADSNSLNRLDPNGKFAVHIHLLVSYRAARSGGWGRMASASFALKTAAVDFRSGSQSDSAKNTSIHSMRGRLPNGEPQSIEEGRASYRRAVADATASGDHAAAAHATQDHEASHHRDHLWEGLGSKAAMGHLIKDVFPPTSEVEAAEAATASLLASCDCEKDYAATIFGETPARYMPRESDWDIYDLFYAGQACIEGICMQPTGRAR